VAEEALAKEGAPGEPEAVAEEQVSEVVPSHVETPPSESKEQVTKEPSAEAPPKGEVPSEPPGKAPAKGEKPKKATTAKKQTKPKKSKSTKTKEKAEKTETKKKKKSSTSGKSTKK